MLVSRGNEDVLNKQSILAGAFSFALEPKAGGMQINTPQVRDEAVAGMLRLSADTAAPDLLTWNLVSRVFMLL